MIRLAYSILFQESFYFLDFRLFEFRWWRGKREDDKEWPHYHPPGYFKIIDSAFMIGVENLQGSTWVPPTHNDGTIFRVGKFALVI